MIQIEKLALEFIIETTNLYNLLFESLFKITAFMKRCKDVKDYQPIPEI